VPGLVSRCAASMTRPLSLLALWPQQICRLGRLPPAWTWRWWPLSECLFSATAAALQANSPSPRLRTDKSCSAALQARNRRSGAASRWSGSRPARLALPYLSCRPCRRVQEVPLQHYPPETPVAIGYRVSWPDQWLQLVPLRRDGYHQPGAPIDPHTLLRGQAGACRAPTQHAPSSISASHDHLFRPRGDSLAPLTTLHLQ